jgi:NADH-quinone oxidoreductase subunit E
VGDTSEDSLFTLQTVACIGCCSLAPVVMVNDDTHGSLNPASTRKLVRKVAREARKSIKTTEKA